MHWWVKCAPRDASLQSTPNIPPSKIIRRTALDRRAYSSIQLMNKPSIISDIYIYILGISATIKREQLTFYRPPIIFFHTKKHWPGKYGGRSSAHLELHRWTCFGRGTAGGGSQCLVNGNVAPNGR